MDNEIKIEKGIPVTKRTVYHKGKWKSLLMKMKVGDSFTTKTKTNRSAIWTASRNLRVKTITRTDKNGDFRIWRVK